MVGQKSAVQIQNSRIAIDSAEITHTYTVSGPSIWTTYDPPCVIIG